jgi:hypothetical protein
MYMKEPAWVDVDSKPSKRLYDECYAALVQHLNLSLMCDNIILIMMILLMIMMMMVRLVMHASRAPVGGACSIWCSLHPDRWR